MMKPKGSMESNSFFSPWTIELNLMDFMSAFFAPAALHPVHLTGGTVIGIIIFDYIRKL